MVLPYADTAKAIHNLRAFIFDIKIVYGLAPSVVACNFKLLRSGLWSSSALLGTSVIVVS